MLYPHESDHSVPFVQSDRSSFLHRVIPNPLDVSCKAATQLNKTRNSPLRSSATGSGMPTSCLSMSCVQHARGIRNHFENAGWCPPYILGAASPFLRVPLRHLEITKPKSLQFGRLLAEAMTTLGVDPAVSVRVGVHVCVCACPHACVQNHCAYN